MTEHGAKLLQDSEDASFACGEWDRNDSDEPYDGVYARGAAAHEALAAYIEGLEVALGNFREWWANHFEDCDGDTNGELLTLDNDAARALGVTP